MMIHDINQRQDSVAGAGVPGTKILDDQEPVFKTLESRLYNDEKAFVGLHPVAAFPVSSTLALSLDKDATKLTLSLKQRIVLGRKTADFLEPLLDLTPYGAFQSGVSRQHATLSRTSDGYLLISDMGSRNGTYINGQRIEPQIRYLLDDGDRLQLGKMILLLSFEHA